MSNNKNKKRVYSKPTKVVEPVEEKIEEITEEVIEVKVIDPEVFETKLFVEEEPEELAVEKLTVEQINEELKETHESFNSVEEIEKVLEANHNLDAEVEITKLIEAASETPSPEGLPTPNELTEKLVELQAKIEDFQVVQVVPESTGLVYGEDYHEDPNVGKTLVNKSPSTAIFDLDNSNPMIEDILTPEQEEEGAQVIAEMVNNSILEDLKALAPEPPTQKTIASLSNAELRHFRRTGQMPR